MKINCVILSINIQQYRSYQTIPDLTSFCWISSNCAVIWPLGSIVILMEKASKLKECVDTLMPHWWTTGNSDVTAKGKVYSKLVIIC